MPVIKIYDGVDYGRLHIEYDSTSGLSVLLCSAPPLLEVGLHRSLKTSVSYVTPSTNELEIYAQQLR